MKFLVGYNGSEVAKAALFLAARYADLFGAKVFVVTSMFGGHQESSKQIEKKAQDLNLPENTLSKKE